MNVTDEPSGTDRFVNNNHPRRHSNDNCARSNINSDIFHRRRRPKSNNNYENNTENNHMRDHRHASSSLPSLTARDIHLIAYIVPKNGGRGFSLNVPHHNRLTQHRIHG